MGLDGAELVPKVCSHLEFSDGKVLLLETTPTQHTKHEKVKLVPIKSFYQYGLVLMVLEDTWHTTKEKR